MNQALLSLTQDELEQGGAQDVVVFPLAPEEALADYVIIASGTSSRHVASLAQRLAEKMKQKLKINPSVEGLPDANWVLVDGHDIIIHIFRPEVRAYYLIEELWQKDK